MLKAAKAQLYLRKAASACRVIKYGRALRRLEKLAGPNGTLGQNTGLIGSATNPAPKVPKLQSPVSTTTTNTANNISNAASQVGNNTQNYLSGRVGISPNTSSYQSFINNTPMIRRLYNSYQNNEFTPPQYPTMPEQGTSAGMTLQPSNSPSATFSQTDGEEEPAPLMGQTAPYIPTLSTPPTQVAQSTPTKAPRPASMAYYDSLSPNDQALFKAFRAYKHPNTSAFPATEQSMRAAREWYKNLGTLSRTNYNRAQRLLTSNGYNPNQYGY